MQPFWRRALHGCCRPGVQVVTNDSSDIGIFGTSALDKKLQQSQLNTWSCSIWRCKVERKTNAVISDISSGYRFSFTHGPCWTRAGSVSLRHKVAIEITQFFILQRSCDWLWLVGRKGFMAYTQHHIEEETRNINRKGDMSWTLSNSNDYGLTQQVKQGKIINFKLERASVAACLASWSVLAQLTPQMDNGGDNVWSSLLLCSV